MTRLARYLIRHGMRQGWRRGVLGDSRVFLIIGGLALLANLLGRASGGAADVVFSEKLAPGETFQIFHEPRA
jgi:hypothetical protein